MKGLSRFIYIFTTAVLIFSMVATNITIVFADDTQEKSEIGMSTLN